MPEKINPYQDLQFFFSHAIVKRSTVLALVLIKLHIVIVGPGCSSVGAGAFSEHGPFRPSGGGILVANDYSWNNGLFLFLFT